MNVTIISTSNGETFAHQEFSEDEANQWKRLVANLRHATIVEKPGPITIIGNGYNLIIPGRAFYNGLLAYTVDG